MSLVPRELFETFGIDRLFETSGADRIRIGSCASSNAGFVKHEFPLNDKASAIGNKQNAQGHILNMPSKVRMPSISFIVARSYESNIIGCENKLPWTMKSDLKRFRKITNGHAVVMGKNTYNSIGKPLPGRTNIVLSREYDPHEKSTFSYNDETQLLLAPNENYALFMADLFSIIREKEDIVVIGGGVIYSMFDKFVNKVYLTEIFEDYSDQIAGDAQFEKKFSKRVWKLISEEDFSKNDEDQFNSRFSVYKRKDRRYRQRYLSDFYTDKLQKDAWVFDKINQSERKIAKYEAQHQVNFEF